MTTMLQTTSLDDLATLIATGGRSQRKSQLRHSSIDNGSLTLKTNGVVSGYLGTLWDGTTGVSVVNGPTPPRPAAPTAWTTLGGVTVRWDGTYFPAVDSAGRPIVAPEDFKGVEIQVSASSTFDDGDAFDNVRGPLMTSARGGDTFVPWEEGNATVYVRLVVRSTSGKASAPSGAVQVTTGPAQANLLPDNVAPGQVTGLTIFTFTETDATGRDVGRIGATWDEPNENADGTTLTDLSHFEVEWKWTARTGTLWESTTFAEPGGIVPATSGLPYLLRVRAIDRSGNPGAWSSTQTITVAKDTTPPRPPQAAVLGNYLGQLRIRWTGIMDDLGDPPADLKHVEAHVGPSQNFTPVGGTKVGDMVTGGELYAAVPYGTTPWVKLVAVDNTGNRSTPSVAVQGSVSKVVADDLIAGAVGSLQLANLAVKSANIDLLAVNTQHISELHVGRLIGGILTADVQIGGRIGTALSGARTEINTLGFQKFRADGTKAVSITDFETLLSGYYRSAESGRRIEMGAAGSAGELNFFAPDGQRSFVKSYTEPDVRQIESIQIGVDMGGHYLWNRININDRNEIRCDAGQVNLHFTNEDNPSGAGQFTVASYDRGAGAPTGWSDRNFVERIRISGNETTFRDRSNITRVAFGPDWFLVRNPSNTHRLNLASTATYIHRADGRIFFEEIPGNIVKIHPSGWGAGEGEVEFLNNAGVAAQSPRMIFVQPDGGGCIWKSFAGVLEARWRGDNGFAAMRAENLAFTSDRRAKRNIRDAVLDATTKVRAMRVRTYAMDRQTTEGGVEEVQQLGIVAQEAPPEIVTDPGSDDMLGIDVGQNLALLTKMLQEVDARLQALENGPRRANA